jgi:putative N-acetylmannosamine-6-phosphate epimerase
LAQALQGADSMVGVIAIDCTTRMRLNGEAEGHLDGIYVRAYH